MSEFVYYDLIELPSGGHVPVPIALELVGEKEIRKIPVSRRRRDDRFFYCPECDELSFFKHTPCDHCDSQEEGDCENCPEIKELELQYRAKEVAFVNLIRKKQYRKLRYIRA
ncbi:hypothetical protein [Archaeoglobus neptunius]|uniref:hypothetical protein n=1 Tax=Archaeoglobus neptunius TaxID=2798580 RepID=UPI0019254642|nr:hypothetical protein [Archaeoglobus neptunius]